MESILLYGLSLAGFNTSNTNYIFISAQLTDVTTDVARLRSVKLIN